MYAKTIEQILAALDSADKRQDGLVAYRRRMTRLRLLCTLVVLLGYADILAYAAASLWRAWQNGVWSPFWDTVRFLWDAFGLFGIGSVFYEEVQHAGQAHVLRARIPMHVHRWDGSCRKLVGLSSLSRASCLQVAGVSARSSRSNAGGRSTW